MAQAVPEVAVGAVLEAVHLIAAAEMHLADEAGAITVRCEMGWPGQVLGKKNPVV